MKLATNKNIQDIVGEKEEIVSRLRRVVERRRGFVEEANESHEEAYNRMVDEAVLLIVDRWKHFIRFTEEAKNSADTVWIKTEKTFYVAEELSLHSDYSCLIANPETDRYCLQDKFFFESTDEVESFEKDILERLPDGVICNTDKESILFYGECVKFSFEYELSMVK